MLKEIIKTAIEQINSYDKENQYIVNDGDDIEAPHILKKREDYIREYVIEDLTLVQSITVTNNTLILYQDGSITIISPMDYTYHQTYV